MYLCNTKRPWQTKIICAFTNIVKMQNKGNLQTDNHQNWRYFQKQQKADPPLECRGRCSSSSCTACLENNSRSYMINSGSPSVNINNSEVQSGNTPHCFIWAVWRNSSSSTPIPTPPVSKRGLPCRTEIPYCTERKNWLYTEKKKKSKSCQRRWDTKICQLSQSVSQLQWKGFLARAEWRGPSSFSYEQSCNSPSVKYLEPH